MNASAVRLMFCVTVAIVAAAIADPLVECTSNSGLFGPGSFTDHSNLDVFPALIAGGFFAVVLVMLRARSTLLARQLKVAGGTITPLLVLRLLPAILILQLATLYGMETLEQVVVYGHSLGGAIWLGGPVAFSLGVHAVLCLCSAVLIARSVRALAHTVVRIVCILRAFATLSPHGPSPIARALADLVAAHEPVAIACRIGKRAPPLPVR